MTDKSQQMWSVEEAIIIETCSLSLQIQPSLSTPRWQEARRDCYICRLHVAFVNAWFTCSFNNSCSCFKPIKQQSNVKKGQNNYCDIIFDPLLKTALLRNKALGKYFE